MPPVATTNIVLLPVAETFWYLASRVTRMRSKLKAGAAFSYLAKRLWEDHR